LWLLAGVAALGTLLNALSLSLIVAPETTWFGVAVIALALITAHLYLRPGRQWRLGGKAIVLKGVGPEIRWFGYGAILLLLFPRAVDAVKLHRAEQRQQTDQMKATFRSFPH
jgi:hypothetical protein